MQIIVWETSYFCLTNVHATDQILPFTVKADLGGEYQFRVATDSSSRVSLSMSGLELFGDLLPPPETSAGSVGSAAEMTSDEVSGGTVILSKGRTGSLLLAAGEMVPLQLRYAVRIALPLSIP